MEALTIAETARERMASVHAAMRARHGRRCMVVVPSRSIERWHEPPAETQAYEERLLCLLLMLRDPGLSLVYVTSAPIAPAIVGYYLSLLPPDLRRDARTRLTLISAGGRELFAQAGVPHPLGVEHVAGGRAALEAIVRLRAEKPELAELVVKLDDAVSGEGNAVVDVRALPRPGTDDERQRIAERLERMSVGA